MTNDVDIDAIIGQLSIGTEAQFQRVKMPDWTKEEDDFVRKYLGWLSEEQIGEALGRTAKAVKTHWMRDLYLTAPSKADDVITALQAAYALGIDGHKTSGWVDMGLIPGRLLAAKRNIRLIDRTTFLRWAVNPNNWIYFDPAKVVDGHLARLIELKKQRWGDEWWSTRRVADYFDIDIRRVNLSIMKGHIMAVQPQCSVGGRHPDGAWKYNFVLKSEVMSLDPLLAFPDICTAHQRHFTPRAEAWIIHAHDDLGLTYEEICRMMKLGFKKFSALGRYYHRIKDGKQ